MGCVCVCLIGCVCVYVCDALAGKHQLQKCMVDDLFIWCELDAPH